MAPEFPYFKYQAKEAEQRLTELQAFVSSLLEGIGEGVIVVDRELKIRSANKGYCEQVNASFDDIIGVGQAPEPTPAETAALQAADPGGVRFLEF